MPYIQVEPGVRLFYEIRGDGPPILFIHGWTMSHDVWEYLIPPLGKHFQTIVLDLRGNGDSDKPWGDYTYDVYARDIAAVVDTLHLRQATLVGWSLGAAIGAKYITHYGGGVEKFVSVAGAIPYFTSRPLIPFGPTRQDVHGWIEQEKRRRPEFTKKFVDSMFASSTQNYTKLWIWSLCMKTSWHVAVRSLKTLRDTDMLSVLPQITIPSAVFHGRFDSVVPIEFGQYTASSLANCKLVEFNHSGHVPFIEESDRFTKELTRFIVSH